MYKYIYISLNIVVLKKSGSNDKAFHKLYKLN